MKKKKKKEAEEAVKTDGLEASSEEAEGQAVSGSTDV